MRLLYLLAPGTLANIVCVSCFGMALIRRRIEPPTRNVLFGKPRCPLAGPSQHVWILAPWLVFALKVRAAISGNVMRKACQSVLRHCKRSGVCRAG